MDDGEADFSLWNKFAKLWPMGKFLFREWPHIIELVH